MAVLVSHDEPRHDKRAWKRIIDNNLTHPSSDELKALFTVKQWNIATHKYNKNIDKNDIVISNATAGHKVSLWYKKVGLKGLNNLIKRVKDGDSFEKAYLKKSTSF